eukprot:7111646-Prymnesium_polylepis.1
MRSGDRSWPVQRTVPSDDDRAERDAAREAVTDVGVTSVTGEKFLPTGWTQGTNQPLIGAEVTLSRHPRSSTPL